MILKTLFTTTTALMFWLCFLGARCLQSHHKIGRCTFIVNCVCPDPSVNFYLYTRNNKDDIQLVTVENVTESYYARSLPNKFILHGFNSNWKLDALQSIKNEFLTNMDVNIWMIDYTDVSSGPDECYVAAVYNLPSVGKCAALFMRRVIDLSEAEDPEDSMHVIGFSLGGQLAGQVAEHLRPVRLPRITGLDPAFPLFFNSHLNRRLSRDDAKFVDVIHTNALVQGQLDPCGDVDFYVNGGMSQPGCNNSSNPFVCDHNRAPVYFSESIGSTEGFWGWPCPSSFDYLSGKCPRQGEHVLMGENVNRNARGVFVLETNGVSPYAQGNWHWTKEN